MHPGVNLDLAEVERAAFRLLPALLRVLCRGDRRYGGFSGSHYVASDRRADWRLSADIQTGDWILNNHDDSELIAQGNSVVEMVKAVHRLDDDVEAATRIILEIGKEIEDFIARPQGVAMNLASRRWHNTATGEQGEGVASLIAYLTALVAAEAPTPAEEAVAPAETTEMAAAETTEMPVRRKLKIAKKAIAAA